MRTDRFENRASQQLGARARPARIRAPSAAPPAASPTLWGPAAGAWGRCAAAAAALALVLSTAVTAQDVLDRGDKIKAAYLYNLGRYVEWPEPVAVDGQPLPFVIGLMAPETLGDELHLIAETKTLDGRPIAVRRFASSREVGPCHILFIPRAVPPDVQRDVIQQRGGKGILFVGETPDFHRIGGVVILQEVGNHIRLVISLAAARRENLKISAKLLQVAQVVD